MNNIKLSIQFQTVPGPATAQTTAQTAASAPSLQHRVEYAISCIECGDPRKRDAIQFLRKVFTKLDKLDHKKEKQLAMLESIKPVMQEYGHYYSEESDG